jgi:hypothetical protein
MITRSQSAVSWRGIEFVDQKSWMEARRLKTFRLDVDNTLYWCRTAPRMDGRRCRLTVLCIYAYVGRCASDSNKSDTVRHVTTTKHVARRASQNLAEKHKTRNRQLHTLLFIKRFDSKEEREEKNHMMLTSQHAKWAIALLSLFEIAHSFQTPSTNSRHNVPTRLSASSLQEESNRRSFLAFTGAMLTGLTAQSQSALAGIDVSSLRSEGSAAGNSDIASQLRAYDGSGSARVKDIKSSTEPSTAAKKPVAAIELDSPTAAIWAYRSSPGVSASLAPTGPLRSLYHCNDSVVAPNGSKLRSIPIQFEFPSDWLQLDRYNGGIQWVDQRDGAKLYVLRAPLPADTTLATLPKATLGGLVFDTNGSLAKSGQTFEDFKVSSAQILNECPNGMCATRRRFKIEYATVTGNGLRVERRALIDAYQVENDIYMLMTSSNALKFDKKDSAERETMEKIVDSFQIEA